MKFYGGVRGGEWNKGIDFDGDPDHHADCPIGNPLITRKVTLLMILNVFTGTCFYQAKSNNNDIEPSGQFSCFFDCMIALCFMCCRLFQLVLHTIHPSDLEIGYYL